MKVVYAVGKPMADPALQNRDPQMAELHGLRDEFRRQIAAHPTPVRFTSRIGAVLSGGGARGAYEAGVLMAFQDAKIPTHIVAATSIGSINAAGFASHSNTTVGNAESLVDSWLELTPSMLGIDWSKYMFLLAGLVAASAGIGNFFWQWMNESGITLHPHHPKLTWFALGAAGVSILLFADGLSYIGYVALNLLRGRHWVPDHGKAWRSLGANLLVWGFVVLFLGFTHIHFPVPGGGRGYYELSAPLPVVLFIALAVGLYRLLRSPLSNLSHRFLRLPLRTGLFANFERTKFLRARIPEPELRASPIRVIMTATDLHRGSARFFSNVPVEVLLGDPDVEPDFIREEVECPPDLVQAAVASSAYTFAYEAVPMDDRLWTDGGIVTNQPIRPAIRLGADVLFLIMVTPMAGDDDTGMVKTFLDVGVHAVDILISRNFKSDIIMLENLNRFCSIYAAEMGVRPEQIELQMGNQRYRYIKAFNIAPEKPLPAMALDFDGDTLRPVIIQGYRDARAVLLDYLDYELHRPARESRQVVRLAAERTEGNFRTIR
ncbi:MAG TPA: patatin-like phospholipase family protein [Candidatus Saccharimonadales bacterium]|nr:patatin-like phospholipase family protein [Candidatus Saccharimonadales bacterium]